MMKQSVLTMLAGALLSACAIEAPMKVIKSEASAGQAPIPSVIDVWPGAAPGSENWTQVEIQHDIGVDGTPNLVARNITRPTITAYLPSRDRATGAAVLIAPGGGFFMLSINSEGADVARWLAERGVAAFVLKYRLMETPPDRDAFSKFVMALLAKRTGSGEHSPEFVKLIEATAPFAVADALQAIRIIRERAPEWQLDPARVGMLGFSAGGMITTQVMVTADAAKRPNFVAPIYGALMPSGALPADLPHIFLAVSADDSTAGEPVYKLAQRLRAEGVKHEFHAFRSGGHGYGLNQQNKSSDHWIDEFYWWMLDLGVLSKGGLEQLP